ncbi:1-acylglycerol-3-phosphate O-acyltransferase ABHD5, partial [Fasciolopsis buskii]
SNFSHIFLNQPIEVPSETDELSLKRGAFHDQAIDSVASSVSVDSTSTILKESNGGSGKLNVDPIDLDGSVALDYVYHINVQRPSGEIGFRSMCSFVAFAYRPMLLRIGDLDPHIPITFIYGSRSWIDMSSGIKTRAARPESYVDIKIIEGAGHQVHAEAAEEFNAYLNAVCAQVDCGVACNPVPTGEQDQNYVELKSLDSSRSTEQRTGRLRSSSSTQKIAGIHSDSRERMLAVAGSLGHEAGDEASE